MIPNLEQVVVVVEPTAGVAVRDQQQLAVTVEGYVGEYFLVYAVDVLRHGPRFCFRKRLVAWVDLAARIGAGTTL